MVQLLWKIIWWFLKKLNTESPDDPELLLLGIYPKELKAGTHTGICKPIFIASLFTIAKR